MTENSQGAEGFIQSVKRKTKRKCTAEDKIRIVLEGMKREFSVAELCRRKGIHAHVHYTWVKNLMEPGRRYNLGSDKAITLRELAGRIAHLSNDQVEITARRLP